MIAFAQCEPTFVLIELDTVNSKNTVISKIHTVNSKKSQEFYFYK